MQEQKTLRQRVERLFGLPAMKMPWTLYLAQLNEAGKMTARSIMDIMTVILETLEQMEEDIKDTRLVVESALKENLTQISVQTPLKETLTPIPTEVKKEEKVSTITESPQISVPTPLPTPPTKVSL